MHIYELKDVRCVTLLALLRPKYIESRSWRADSPTCVCVAYNGISSSDRLQEYAARVNSLRSYDAISRDIIARWVYPFCPDTNLFADADYRFRRGHLYM